MYMGWIEEMKNEYVLFKSILKESDAEFSRKLSERLHK